MKIYIQTNKATTNIFGLHTQPRKTTRYTNKLKLESKVWCFSYCVTFFDIFEHFFHFCFVTFVYASTIFLTLQQKIMHIAIINNMHKFYENEKIAAILIVCLTCEIKSL